MSHKSLTFRNKTLTHHSSVCGMLISALINDKWSDYITVSMILHCFSDSGVRGGGMKGQLIFGRKLR